jgi:hypothetical protein
VSDYNLLQRLLHYTALANTSILEAALDAELTFCRAGLKDCSRGKHVFVSGLARGGTTVLLRSLYASGQFASLTYADMPFVLAPNLWSKISGKSRKKPQLKERAHGDGILVDVNSPEALDEVFWRAVAGNRYILADHLVPHDCDEETVEKYGKYVSAVLLRYNRDRYLSKNNNNILRIRCIFQALPNATILIPFRDPVQQAHSLLSQHLLFNSLQTDDTFVRRYMSWLGHHEFGPGHKSLQVEGGLKRHADPEKIEYWLQQWYNEYTFILRELERCPGKVLCISYELFCSETAAMWQAVCNRLEIADAPTPDMQVRVRDVPPGTDPELLAAAGTVYGKLMDRCRQDLCL